MRLSKVIVISVLVVGILFSVTMTSVPTTPVAAANGVIIDDFESGLPAGTDGDGNSIGFLTFNNPGSTVAIATTDAPPAPVPGASDPNNVLQVDTNVVTNGWAGLIHAFENETVDTWVTQDWSGYEGISFWLYGNNTGTILFIDILDNRNPGSTVDDAERYSIDVIDDFAGWQFFEIPFEDFHRKEVGNGAPNDGFTLTQVHGWGFGVFSGGQALTHYVDGVGTYGTRPLQVTFSSTNYEVDEGDTAEVVVKLSRALGFLPDDPGTVTVDYAVEPGTAAPDRDYVPVAPGTLTFVEGGPLEQSFPLSTIGDAKYEGDERVILRLSNPVGAAAGLNMQAAGVILDDDPYDPLLLDDFESFPYLFDALPNFRLDTREIEAGDPLALPGQGAYEGVLEVTRRGAGFFPGVFRRRFALGQDWSDNPGLSFWFYGNDTGRDVEVTLLDNQAADPGPGGWKLVWRDEFFGRAGKPPNPRHWGYEIGDGTANGIPGWGNDELQYYTDSTENVATDGRGHLVIRAKEADGSLMCHYGPCEYTSARLISRHRAEFAYGRIEARVKVPPGAGLWPAFWALGTDIGEVGWPQCGEIDIMEFVGREPYEVFGTIHGPGYSGGASFGDTYTFDVPVYEDYHTFAVEWQPDLIEWYVDDILYHTATPAEVAPNEWVYNHPFFIIMNMAVGGNFGGPVGEDTEFPAEMVVDYVRVYQARDTAERFQASFVDDFVGWQQVEIPFTAFSRSRYQLPHAPDDGLNLTEVWGYGFEIPRRYPERNILLDQVRLSAPTEVTVVNTNDSGGGSLRKALDIVATGGTILFDPGLAGDTVTLTSGPLVISKDVTIDGSTAPGLTLSGNDTSLVVEIGAGLSVSINDLTIANGHGWDGGGVYVGEGGALTLLDSTLADNYADHDGGGIFAALGSTIHVERSTLSGNWGNVGGALRTLGDATIVNSTLSGNGAFGWWGGAIFHTDGVMDVVNSTITGNVGPDWAPSAIFVGSWGQVSELYLTNSIVANNQWIGCYAHSEGGTPTLAADHNNLFTDDTCSPGASDLIVADPLLGPLADNGGPTLTHALLAGSPAIDAADNAVCPATDQRGVARPQGAGCDTGAFELE